MDKRNIYVTGFAGSDRKGLAAELAEKTGYELEDTDRIIEETDGRTIRRICMLEGEHSYRNKEYEALKALEGREPLVVCCGDGIILDDMCCDIIKKGKIVIADIEKTAEELWERAKDDNTIPYAYVAAGDFDKYKELYDIRMKMFKEMIEE